jgi:hypothetical protein
VCRAFDSRENGVFVAGPTEPRNGVVVPGRLVGIAFCVEAGIEEEGDEARGRLVLFSGRSIITTSSVAHIKYCLTRRDFRLVSHGDQDIKVFHRAIYSSAKKHEGMRR